MNLILEPWRVETPNETKEKARKFLTSQGFTGLKFFKFHGGRASSQWKARSAPGVILWIPWDPKNAKDIIKLEEG